MVRALLLALLLAACTTVEVHVEGDVTVVLPEKIGTK